MQTIDSYNLANATGTIPADHQIIDVTVHFRCYDSFGAADEAQPFLILGSVNTTGTEVTLANAWTNYNEILDKPGGGVWTHNDIDNLQVGIGLRENGGDGDVWCTQVYIEVGHSAPVVSVSATGVSSGEYIIRVSLEGG